MFTCSGIEHFCSGADDVAVIPGAGGPHGVAGGVAQGVQVLVVGGVAAGVAPRVEDVLAVAVKRQVQLQEEEKGKLSSFQIKSQRSYFKVHLH